MPHSEAAAYLSDSRPRRLPPTDISLLITHVYSVLFKFVICIATRSHNGGLIDLLDLRKLLGQKRKATLESLSEDDCLRAISKLKVLGSGFEVISVGRRKLVRSVPTELNKDHSGILGLAQAEGYVTVEQVEREFSWSTGRAIDALETLLKEGLAMIDDGHRDGKRRYWFPCVTVSSDTAAVEKRRMTFFLVFFLPLALAMLCVNVWYVQYTCVYEFSCNITL
ncbi:vacuolar protein sorting-associated protein 22 homolog 1-like [Miscanthus floridulus]|uniref:vacuolar protein sorting-associated protein 22 homolog 1-like n=1 Tax=Miscanthus floridulus TaxID=154761 RepID=UPI00345AF64C